MFDPQKILILAPHTDDGELGCGGTIAKFCAEGREVHYVAFCSVPQPPSAVDEHTLKLECKKATSILGIPASRLKIRNYVIRELPEKRNKILQEMLELNTEIKPDLVLLPAVSDIHQDHQVIHQEGMRAFKNTSFAGYELPWNNYSIHTNFFIRLTEAEINKKIESLKVYESQASKNYMTAEFIRSLAKVRGVQANSMYAEAFEVYRLIS